LEVFGEYDFFAFGEVEVASVTATGNNYYTPIINFNGSEVQ